MMRQLAAIDTNVLVSALLSKGEDAATVQVFRAIFEGRLILLYHQQMLAEYEEVLRRPKFHLPEEAVRSVMSAIRQFGIEVDPSPTGEILIDMDDLIFYEVAMEKRKDGARLVTGNQRHFPITDLVVTPSEMMDILNGRK